MVATSRRRATPTAIDQFRKANGEESKPILRRIELGEPFAGHNIVFKASDITFGFIEDLQAAANVGVMLDLMASVILASDMIPPRTDGQPTDTADVRAWLRTFTIDRMKALQAAMTSSAVAAPKDN